MEVGIVNKNGIKYEYHHIGVPTDKPRKVERYSSTFKMYTTLSHKALRYIPI